jgi:acetylornithine deacetylase
MLDPVSLLKKLVSLPSDSGHEEQVVACLQQVMEDIGWQPQRHERNLFALLGQSGPLLLLNSHTDTVPPGEGWTKPPYGAMEEKGRIYGRGSNDAKGCLVAMIVGAARYWQKHAATPPGRLCLAATCEEEVMGHGLETLLPTLPRADAAVVGEPTGLHPAVAQKGLVVLELIAHGSSAHVAWGGGLNAISLAVQDHLALEALPFERLHPFLGATTLAVTQIEGGTRHNVIPDRCRMVVDIRLTPAYRPSEVVECIRGVIASELKVRSERLVPVEISPDAPIVQAVLRAHPQAQPFGSPTLSDWVFLREIPTVKIGPGDSHRSHTPDEYLEIEELLRGVDFYERLIGEYFAQPSLC